MSVAGNVLALGKFDALHRGHQALFATAAQHGQVLVLQLTDMATTLGWTPRLPLVSAEQRAELLARWQINTLSVPFADIREQDAATFCRWLAREHGIGTIVLGANCRLGRNRHADATWLQQHGPTHGMQVEVVPLISASYAGGNGSGSSDSSDSGDDLGRSNETESDSSGDMVISSTSIRELLTDGAVATIRTLLDRPYRLTGQVVRGDQRGRQLGFATANVANIAVQLPTTGVYAAMAQLSDGRRFRAGVNIGRLPTVSKDRPLTVEAHLLDYDGDCYDQTLSLDLITRLRGEQRFNGLDQLVQQITTDIAQVAAMPDEMMR